MSKTKQVYFQDMLQAISKIEEYTQHISKTDFLSNGMCQDAVIRQFEILGEASKKLLEIDNNIETKISLKEAIKMRNILNHGYDQVEIDIVWDTIHQSLPEFKKQIENVLI